MAERVHFRFLLSLSALLVLACGSGADGSVRLVHAPHPAPAGGEYVVAHPLARLALPGAPRTLTINGQTLYVFLNQDGMAILDIANPSSPTLVTVLRGEVPQGARRPRYFYSGVLDGHEMVVTDRSHNALMIYDVSRPLDPKLLRIIDFTSGTPVSVIPTKDHYIVSMGARGVIRVPREAGAAGTPQPLLVECDFVKDIVLWPPHFLIAADNYDGGLKVVDLGDDARPRLAGTYLTGNFCEAIIPFDGFAAVSNRLQGLLVLDLARPAEPALLSYWNNWPFEYIRAMARWGETGLALANHPTSVDLIDLGNPAKPNWMARIPFPRPVNCLAVGDDLLIAGIDWPLPNDPSRAGYHLATFRLERRKSELKD